MTTLAVRLRMFLAVLFGLAVTLGASGPSRADQIDVPTGCSPVVTVHEDYCVVSNILRCEAGFEVHVHSRGRLDTKVYYDSNWGLKRYELYRIGNMLWARDEQSWGGFSLNDLIITGKAEERGKFTMNTRVIRDRVYELTGEMRLGDEIALVGDIPFRKGRAERLFETKSGRGGLSFGIDIYVSEDLGVLLEGSLDRAVMGDPAPSAPRKPMRISTGGTGFLADTSEFGC